LFADADAARAAAKQTGIDVTIRIDDANSIVLRGFSLANLRATDFAIVPAGMASVSMPSGRSSVAVGSSTGAQHQMHSSLAQLVQAMASYSATSAGADLMVSTQMPDAGLQNAIAPPFH
jgi:hypothetical protein